MEDIITIQIVKSSEGLPKKNLRGFGNLGGLIISQTVNQSLHCKNKFTITL